MIRMNFRTSLTAFAAVALVIQCFVVAPAFAADDEADRKKQELLQKIKELEAKKVEQQKKLEAKTEDAKPSGQQLSEIIAKYEKILEGCSEKKSERCADVMLTLGSLYYDEARDNYIAARERYENQMNEWEKKRVGAEPVNPVPDYTRPVKMYARFVAEYAQHPKLYEAYYQLGNIKLIMGDMDGARVALEDLVKKFPTSRRSSAAYFRLSDFAFIDHDYSKALQYIQKINIAELTLEVTEMVMYRKAECLYNQGDFEQAVELYHDYREKCESGTYQKCQFREDAVEWMAICFSDMPEGGDKATKFFKKVGPRPYEDQVLYLIGMKNRNHGQYDDAIKALEVALKRFPYYKDAPLAQQALVECYLIKKQYDPAIKAREKLIDVYSRGGEWYQKNQTQKAVIEQADLYVRRALASVGVYYHAQAQKSKDRGSYESALKRYTEFFQRFPEDKWRVFELKYYAGEIHNQLGDYKKAAELYDFVASEDLQTYPKMEVELDTLGLDQEEIERMKKEREKQFASISQEDAGYNTIVALDNSRKKAIAKSGSAEDKAYELPETKAFLAYIRKFQQRFPQSQNAADVLYLGANVYYGVKAYQPAIAEFQHIVNNYPTSPLAAKSLRLLANCYTNTGEYDLALAKYRELMAKSKSDSPEYQEVLDLAAGALYKKASEMKTSKNFVGAADAFKAIHASFPTSKVSDRAWFEAGDCYEQAGTFDIAAATFEDFAQRFPKSELTERAYMRSAEDYKKVKQLEKAAQVYISAANALAGKADFAIPSLAAAAQCYTDLEKFDLAGKTFGMIYERYSNDPKTPQALYNAGLLFEKGSLFEEAIKVYSVLSERFPNSEFSAEAAFSIGLCYEKMGRKDQMAQTFQAYATKYPDDRYKQVEALTKAGDAYMDMKDVGTAEKCYTLATAVHREWGKKADMDVATVARAYYKLGDIKYDVFKGLQLDGKTEAAVKTQVQDKTKGLEEAAKLFAKAIEVGVEEWTVRATYKIGQGFVDLADGVADQRLFGRKDQQIASKIRILSSLEKYYSKAQEYFYKNIEWAFDMGIKGEYVDRSVDQFMEMAYRKGELLEKVGELFRDAPVPPDLAEDEKQAYRELLEEKYLASLDAALPKYEEAVAAAREVGIAQNPWLDKVKGRITEINPGSEVLTWQITARTPKERPKEQQVAQVVGKPGAEGTPSARPTNATPEYDRNMRRIKNISEMDIPLDDKLKQIGRIEAEARRNIEIETERIRQLKEQLGQTVAN